MRDYDSTDLAGAAYLAREDEPFDDGRAEDARLEELELRPPPRAGKQCEDCGVARWSVCVCRMEEEGWEDER